MEKEVYKKAVQLFKSGIAQDPLVDKSGKVEPPIPVVNENGEINSWFIGVTVKETLAGFMQMDTNLSLMRYSTFQKERASLRGCPQAYTWLDPNYILNRVKARASDEDVLSVPILTYDRNPSRIVWVVKATDKNGKVKSIHAAGDFVYI